MKTILNDSKDPRFNLALEEYVLKTLNHDDDFVLLWQNANSVIIGRNQNTLEEINAQYVKDHDVKVVRRITGGGTVYHDLGNLNFSFITENLKDNLNNYKKFTQPVIDALQSLGIPAEFQGRNDIVVEDKKISGNAQSYYKNKMLHHGTILFDADLSIIADVLNVKVDKIASKGIKSNRARVTNIKPYLKEPMDVVSFKELLLKHLLQTDTIIDHVYALTEADYHAIETLMQERYMTFEWNYGESPESQVVREKRYAGGSLQLHFDVKEGRFAHFKIFGDFLGSKPLEDLEKDFVNISYNEDAVRAMLEHHPVEEYFFNITADDVIDCLFYS